MDFDSVMRKDYREVVPAAPLSARNRKDRRRTNRTGLLLQSRQD
jgi:hypothetical protein